MNPTNADGTASAALIRAMQKVQSRHAPGQSTQMLAGRKFIREFDPADARPVPTSTLMQFAATRPPLSSAERPYLDELKADIAKNGIKRPVLVIGDKLADGLHRVTVANELGLETVPTVIKTTAEFHAAVGATP